MDTIMADIVVLAAISGVKMEILVARPRSRPQPRVDPDPRGRGRGRADPDIFRPQPRVGQKSEPSATLD